MLEKFANQCQKPVKNKTSNHITILNDHSDNIMKRKKNSRTKSIFEPGIGNNLKRDTSKKAFNCTSNIQINKCATPRISNNIHKN